MATMFSIWVMWIHLCGDGVCVWAADEQVHRSQEDCQSYADRKLVPYYPLAPRWAGYERMHADRFVCKPQEQPNE